MGHTGFKPTKPRIKTLYHSCYASLLDHSETFNYFSDILCDNHKVKKVIIHKKYKEKKMNHCAFLLAL